MHMKYRTRKESISQASFSLLLNDPKVKKVELLKYVEYGTMTNILVYSVSSYVKKDVIKWIQQSK